MSVRAFRAGALLFGRAIPLALCLVFGLLDASLVEAAERDYYQLVVFGDPHLPGKRLDRKEAVVATVNSWTEADAVAVLGDICEDTGSSEEYAAAKQFFG